MHARAHLCVVEVDIHAYKTVYVESAGQEVFSIFSNTHIVFLKKPNDKICQGKTRSTCMQRSGEAIWWVIVLNHFKHHNDYAQGLATPVWTQTTVLHTDHTPLLETKSNKSWNVFSWGPTIAKHVFQVDQALLLLSLTLPRPLCCGCFLGTLFFVGSSFENPLSMAFFKL